jgi:hypothetical protein
MYIPLVTLCTDAYASFSVLIITNIHVSHYASGFFMFFAPDMAFPYHPLLIYQDLLKFYLSLLPPSAKELTLSFALLLYSIYAFNLFPLFTRALSFTTFQL